MKKTSTRSVIIVLLTAASIGSFLYLKCVSGGMDLKDSVGIAMESPADAAEESSASEITLPDVRLLKNVVETGKRFIPSN